MMKRNAISLISLIITIIVLIILTGTEYTSDFYYYAGIDKIANTTEEYKMIFGNSSNINYWLASRCVSVYSGYVNFYVRDVSSGLVDAGILYGSDGARNDVAFAVRPVVVLKSNVQVTGSGTETEPYTINEN